MKEVLFTALITAFVLQNSFAQTFQNTVVTPPKQKVVLKTTAPPPATTNKTSNDAEAVSVYRLTAVKVIIRTGNDNKEFPSKVSVTLLANSDKNNWRTYIQTQLGNEMRINADAEFYLRVEGTPIPLETFQTAGLRMSLTYVPNFFADAWKIESVKLALEFKDQFGNLHPTFGNKTIHFSNAYGFLDNNYRYLKCLTDGAFTPMTAAISNDPYLN